MVDVLWSERHAKIDPPTLCVGWMHIDGDRVARLVFDFNRRLFLRAWDSDRIWNPIEPMEAG